MKITQPYIHKQSKMEVGEFINTITRYVNNENILLIAELYGIIFPENLRNYDNKREYLLNEISNYGKILNREPLPPIDFYKISQNKFENIKNYYTLNEISGFAKPLVVYDWKDREDFCHKLWNLAEKIMDYDNNFDFTLERLSKYSDRKHKWEHPLYNPHVFSQAIGNSKQFKKYESKLGLEFVTKYNESKERIPYRDAKGENQSAIQWGQRKLLLSEIEFLTKYGHLSNVIVYAGAAPGTHIPLLCMMFPSHTFHLYDPAPFGYNVTNYTSDNNTVNIYNEFFTREIAEFWSGQNVLFISDIRTGDSQRMTFEHLENKISEDMQFQLEWCTLMLPIVSSLKMRLTWDHNIKTTEYFDGELYFQCWAPNRSTELKLITTQKQVKEYMRGEVKVYNNLEYEERCYYHNTVRRIALFPHKKINTFDGIDHCYDCTRELGILEEYVNQNGNLIIGEKEYVFDELISLISEQISNGKRKLKDGNVDKEKRSQLIEEKQFVGGVHPSLRKEERQATAFDSKIIKMFENFTKDKKKGEDDIFINMYKNNTKGLGFQ